jgi:hypothetical protein
LRHSIRRSTLALLNDGQFGEGRSPIGISVQRIDMVSLLRNSAKFSSDRTAVPRPSEPLVYGKQPSSENIPISLLAGGSVPAYTRAP